VADTVDFCIFANSIEQSHTARHFNHEFSIAGTERFPLLTHAVLTVSDSQAIEVRWKVTTATSHTGYCQRRTLTLIPVSASSTQVTATGDDTTSSTDFSVTLGSMTATPGAGTYLLIFSTTMNANLLDEAIPSIRVYVNSSHTGYEHTERQYRNEASFDDMDVPMFLACVVTPGASEVVDIRWAETAGIGTINCHERTLSVIPVESADILEAAADQSDTFTSTSWELMTGADAGDDDMDIVDPGAGDWLALFGCNWTVNVAGGVYAEFAFYEGASRDAETERRHDMDDSYNAGDMHHFAGVSGRVTLASATDDLELWWQGSSSDTRTVYERTLVLLRPASGGYSIDANAGSYTVTGVAADLVHNGIISANPGSYALTGVAAGLASGAVITASPDSYSLTGVAATLVADRQLEAVPGSYAKTGTAATLAADRVLSADPGSYSKTGIAATLVGPSAFVSADPGAYSKTGIAAALAADRILSADAGSYTKTGIAAGLAWGAVITADPGSYAKTGVAASLIADQLIAATAGSYSLTGVAATLVHTAPARLTADPGSYALTGVAATVVHDGLLSADPASYAKTGVAATLQLERNLEADPGSYAVTGAAATVVAVRLISADPGSYALTGIAADLVRSVGGVPAAITISDAAVSVVVTLSDAPVATLQLSDAAVATVTISDTSEPSSVRSIAFGVDPSSYAVTGVAATLEKSFSAFDIPGCVLWLRSSSLSLTDGQQVETWVDESGQGNHATQSTASKRPLFYDDQINGKPALRFDGEDDWMIAAVNDILQPFTFFAVAKANDKSDYYNIVGGGDLLVRLMIWSGTGALHINAGLNVTGATDRAGAFHYFTGLYNGASSYGRTDGVEDCAGDAGSNDIITDVHPGMYIGSESGGGTWFFNGDLCEVIVYDNEPSVANRNTVESYLATEYDL
jgi:hypothetical protein